MPFEFLFHLAALIVHQNTRYEQLISQLRKEQSRLDAIHVDISKLEQQRTLSRRQATPSSCVSVEDIDKLTAENRRLQIDIEFIGKEIAKEQKNRARQGSGDVGSSSSGGGDGARNRVEVGGPTGVGDAENFHNNIGWSGQSGRPVGSGVSSPAPSRSGSTRRSNNDGGISSDNSKNWPCFACTFRNHPDLDNCEMCQMPRFKGTMVPAGHGNGCYCHPPG